MKLTGGRGVDTAIEAVGVPATFGLCEQIVAPGGVIANIGVHGAPVALHLERLWDRNISITTRLVDTASTPMLLKVFKAGKIDPKLLITHRFKLGDILQSLRDLRQRRRDQGAEGDHRSLTASGPALSSRRTMKTRRTDHASRSVNSINKTTHKELASPTAPSVTSAAKNLRPLSPRCKQCD